ncbi:MAG TPA: NAD(P)H-hydrate dehydratase, partial [Dehalococcoidia bacterium]|nr:NAD(P)H-hydrate dehydratase [Dehalococcoidia bacterium]
RVSLYLSGREDPEEPLLLECRRRQVPWARGEEDQDLAVLGRFLATADAVLDALLGTGRFRPLEGLLKTVLEKVEEEKKKRPGLKLIALDLPSGLDPDTGKLDPATPAFDATITVGHPKRGLYAFPGASHTGKIAFVDLGLPHEAAADIATEVITPEFASRLLPARPAGANKGTFGRVLVAAGSENYIGAACLACLGAYRVGAGLVALAAPRSLYPIFASGLTEATHLPLPDEGGFLSLRAWQALAEKISGYDVLLLGCGIARAPVVSRFMEAFLGAGLKKPLVLDADGLNHLAGRQGWWERLPEAAVLTPHPGEMARLTGLAMSEIQGDRLEVARRFAGMWGKVLVLKGAFTVIASPGGEVRLSPFANP